MSEFKIFENKSLDAAILDACEYFNTGREKLEIEILNDAKTGIFGLVGVKKAKIKAKKVASLCDVNSAIVENKKSKFLQTKTQQERTEKSKFTKQNGVDKVKKEEKKLTLVKREDEADGERAEAVSLLSLEQEKLCSVVEKTCLHLITPIVENAKLDIEVNPDRVDVLIYCEDGLGLLIGREGQTLASIQYIASRIVSKSMDLAVRLQLDAGDYREKQDEKLRELAINLAERAKATGKVYPTKPLSSYQRRIVHMALHGVQDIQTRSSGLGSFKRVIIQHRREVA